MEVGPGKGALTRPLLARGLNVLAVEVDARLAARLHEELGGEALRVVEADALAFDAAGALAEAGAVPPVPRGRSARARGAAASADRKSVV